MFHASDRISAFFRGVGNLALLLMSKKSGYERMIERRIKRNRRHMLAFLDENKGRLDSARAWREENAETIASSNAYVERHGLPFNKFRLF